MTAVSVKYYMGIENMTRKSQEMFSFQGGSVGEFIRQLIQRYPAMKTYFEEKDGVIEPVSGLSILVNGQEIMWLRKMATPLSEEDEIILLRFVSGG